MRRRCRVALVAWALAFAVGCPEDGDAGPADSNPTLKSDLPPDVAMAERLQLEQRSFPLLIWAAYITEQDYFDKGRLAPRAQLRFALDELGLHTPEFFAEVSGDTLTITVRAQKREFSLAQLDEVMQAAERLEEVLVFTQSVLDLEDEPLHELEYAAINGFLAPLDPHTILLTPEQHADLGVKTRGHFGGIGAEIRTSDRRIAIVRVLPGSPAEKQGLKNGDVIVQIGDQSTVNMSSQQAQELIRGPVGTKIELRIRRGAQVLTVEVTRDTIKIESVKSTMLPDRVGYVSISTFQKDTADKLEEAVAGMVETGELAGLIVDLRGNSGGLLTQASGILDQMSAGGEVVIVHSAKGRESEVATEKLVVPESTRVVVLVDEDSASASEIVGGSVKHLGRGVVLGRGSFGKGTVQMLKAATPYGRELALKLTVAEYRVAGDRKIQGVGVRPDLELVPVQLSELDEIAAFYDDERFERQRERARTAHLPSAKHDEGADAFVGKPPPRLRYLDAPELIPGAEGERPEQLRDPEIRLAHQVAIGLVGKGTRPQMLAALGGLVDRLAAQEDEHIQKALAQRKLDWTGEVGAALEATFEVSTKIDPASAIPAGEPFTLEISVKNTGAKPAERVHAITDCNQDELDGIEVLFGRIEPDQTLVRRLLLHVMPWHTDFSGQLGVEVHAGEPGSSPDAAAESRFDVVGSERPRFSFDYWIVDDPAVAATAPKRPKAAVLPGEEPFTVSGNGDGMLQAGERVLLAFEVHNDGAGEAQQTRALLRNLSGAQGLLEEGLFEIGGLAPGARARGAFGITISPKADPALPLELDLAIGDAHLRESARRKMQLRVIGERPTFEPAKQKMKVKAESARVYNGADASASIVAELPSGARVDVVGRAGGWAALAPEKGRHVWVPADLLEPGNGTKAKLARAGLLVDPPEVSLAPVVSRTAADKVTVAGTATHPRRVRDVVVRVKPTAPGAAERKISYQSNPQISGDQAREMAFSAEVPLEKGANRIIVIVRDGTKVERRRDVLVYRE